MKKLIFLIASILCGQTAQFPGAIATDQQMGLSANNIFGSLNSTVQLSDTNVKVTNGTCSKNSVTTTCNLAFLPNMFITLDSEIMQICSVTVPGSYTQLNLGIVGSSCPSINARGLDGSTKVAHNLLTSKVYNNIIAWNHNANMKEIEAIENQARNTVAYPENYGAVGDGTTDDTTALQAWLDSCAQILQIPAKSYRFTTTLTASCTAGRAMQGAGSGGAGTGGVQSPAVSKLFCDIASHIPCLKVGNSSGNLISGWTFKNFNLWNGNGCSNKLLDLLDFTIEWTVQDLFITGNTVGNCGGAGTGYANLFLENRNYGGRIIGSQFINNDVGVQFSAQGPIWIGADTRILFAASKGLYLPGGSYNTTCNGLSIEGNTARHLEIDNDVAFSCQGLTVEAYQTTNIPIYITTSGSTSNLTFLSLTINGNGAGNGAATTLISLNGGSSSFPLKSITFINAYLYNTGSTSILNNATAQGITFVNSQQILNGGSTPTPVVIGGSSGYAGMGIQFGVSTVCIDADDQARLGNTALLFSGCSGNQATQIATAPSGSGGASGIRFYNAPPLATDRGWADTLLTAGILNIAPGSIGSGVPLESVKLPHLGGNSTEPTYSTGGGAGAGASYTHSGTDISGEFCVTAAGTPATNTNFFNVNFNKTYVTAPHVVVTPDKNQSTNIIWGLGNIFKDATTATGFSLKTGTAAPIAATQYCFQWEAIK